MLSEKSFSELKRKLPTLWTHLKFIEVGKNYIEEQKGYDINI